jgi:hypothetical protein
VTARETSGSNASVCALYEASPDAKIGTEGHYSVHYHLHEELNDEALYLKFSQAILQGQLLRAARCLKLGKVIARSASMLA